MLAVEDPKDTSNDLCRGSYQILKIRAAFEYAYQQLGAPASREESILQRIIRCCVELELRICLSSLHADQDGSEFLHATACFVAIPVNNCSGASLSSSLQTGGAACRGTKQKWLQYFSQPNG